MAAVGDERAELLGFGHRRRHVRRQHRLLDRRQEARPRVWRQPGQKVELRPLEEGERHLGMVALENRGGGVSRERVLRRDQVAVHAPRMVGVVHERTHEQPTYQNWVVEPRGLVASHPAQEGRNGEEDVAAVAEAVEWARVIVPQRDLIHEPPQLVLVNLRGRC